MNDESRQPKEYNLVLGGNNPPLTDGLVLGGIEGVKRCLVSDDIKVRIAALSDAIKYGDEGLDLVIEALQDKSDKVGIAAYKLLRDRKENKIKQAIINFNPYRFLNVFTTSTYQVTIQGLLFLVKPNYCIVLHIILSFLEKVLLDI
ncbi:hypothetical protein H1P_3260004 [Hyella patelloides LEGE 07179]|uniref:HEAT repeat domain-containing protein n=1 Tax=Hyella patelloides LEGE 07179 TaxID=945734 RepID=A0A563VVA1_9CYAN|nr:hypothetical protein [Hyella patelloides]VEP15326.1 hypothetical protein H1P_3260004 [Hyella patelloides LEGE 07179]